MKKKLFLTAILTLLCCTLLIAGASATSDTPMGAGTKDDPYKLSNADHLKWFANLVNNSSEGADNTGACAELTCDINLGGSAWTPIGDNNNYYGTFDGRGHTISGLNCSDSEGCAGLFGYVGDGGTVMNVTVTGTVSGATAGGVCGYSAGSITNCGSTGDVTGSGNTGGVCGLNDLGTITGSFSTGTVTGATIAAGVCGQSNSGTITNCCWLEGTAGYGIGTTGVTGATEMTSAQFTNGEVTWLLNGESTDGPWRQNLGTGTGSDDYPTLDPMHKKVIEDADGGYTNEPEYENGISSTGEYQQPATDENGVYQIANAGNLYWFAGLVNGTLGDGTSKDTAANAVLTADITINKDIDDPTYKWMPIGDVYNQYTGTFDGRGHTISGLYCSISSGSVNVYAGLFGYIGSGGTVKNVKVDGTVSACKNAGVGGVSGYNRGTINNCSFSGNVNVTSNGDKYVLCAVGGVCGYNVFGTITNCCNTGNVSGDSGAYVGGVCGYNNGATITNCYWLKEEGSNLEGIGNDTDMATQVDSKTAEQFASGEVAYLLNTWDGDSTVDGKVWVKGDNGYPVLRPDTVNTVVKLTVDGAASYHNSPFEFNDETGKAYLDETGTRITLPYEVTTDTILTSKTLVTVTADSFDLFVGDAAPTLTCTISPEVEVVGIELKCEANMYTPGVYEIKVTGPEYDDLHVYAYVSGTLTVRNSWIVTVDGEVKYVQPGDTFKMPPAPSKPGYIFMGWSDGKTTWQPNDVVDITTDLTIKSVWANMPDITPTEPDEGLPFTDVPEGAWYYEAVKQVYEAGLMNGVTDTLFDPDGTLTRAMFWTILARASGVDTDGGATWYAVAQQWAVENGVSDGTDAMGALTREQLVTMLWRLNGEPVVNYLITTPDANQISPWALEAMKWAASTGLIEGDENGNLTPTATCTRAQAATFLVRYLTAE